MGACMICEKHLGKAPQPPGGYIYEDEAWMVCHFPADQSVLGQLVVESKRHVLDFSEMTDHEVQAYGVLMKRLYTALKQVTGAERIYTLILLEGIPHFHAHLIPRHPDSTVKGLKLLSQSSACDEEDVVKVVGQLREVLGS
ncbi:MAG: hypothetical protein K6T83_01880 [Alicyclobacillus sp.]|nr:hypothetical protein [Alicyclobacillus sp.]